MKVYHRTPKAEVILKEGFQDNWSRKEGKDGVYVANSPPEIDDGAVGMTTLSLEVPDEVIEGDLCDHSPDHSWCAYFPPASKLNQYGRPEIYNHDFKGSKYTDIFTLIADWRRRENNVEADWLEDDIPLLQEHCLLANDADDAGLEHLKGLTKLKYLRLANNKVTDAGLVHLKGLTGLRELDLNGIKVTDVGLVHLKGLTNLEWFWLRDTEVSDAGLVHLKGLTNLQGLSLTGTEVSDAGLVHLKGLTNLKELNLIATEVSDVGLVHLKGLTKLEMLGVRGPRVSDAGLVHLKGLINLKELNLFDTQVSDAGVADLKKALPNCKFFH